MGIDRRRIKYILLLGSAEEESIELVSKVEDIMGSRLGRMVVRRLVLTEHETAGDTHLTFVSLRALKIPKGSLLVGFGLAGLLAACYQDRRRGDLHVIAICPPEPYGAFIPRTKHRNLTVLGFNVEGGPWKSLAEVYDVLWLMHGPTHAKYSLTTVICKHLEDADLAWEIRYVFDAAPVKVPEDGLYQKFLKGCLEEFCPEEEENGEEAGFS